MEYQLGRIYLKDDRDNNFLIKQLSTLLKIIDTFLFKIDLIFTSKFC